MRPRRFRRGKPASPAPTRRRWTCFNEAPAIPPGKTCPRCGVVHSPRIRFNEAPAIPPGKTRTCTPTRPRRRASFNEAPAIPPGKTGLSREQMAWRRALQ